MRTSGTETTTTTTTAAGTTMSRPSPARRTATKRARAAATAPPPAAPGRNEVVLSGRVAVDAEERELPSGDRIVTLRVVVPRDDTGSRRRPGGETPKRATVDTIDVVCWTAATRRSALRLRSADVVEVHGALRRRFFGGPAGRQSRYEVEAGTLRRVSGAPASGT